MATLITLTEFFDAFGPNDRHEVTLAAVPEAELNKVEEWIRGCGDGMFTVRYRSARGGKEVRGMFEGKFWFSNPDTAFAFKMRWA